MCTVVLKRSFLSNLRTSPATAWRAGSRRRRTFAFEYSVQYDTATIRFARRHGHETCRVCSVPPKIEHEMNTRLRRMAYHLVREPSPVGAAAMADKTTSNTAGEDEQLKQLFGSHCYSEGPLFPTGGGRKFHGLDLVPQLSPNQTEFLLDALATHRIVCIAGQDLERFSMAHFERFANHWGALLPHPNNFTRGGVGAQGRGATDGEIEWIPFEQRTVSRANQTFPGQLQCLPHDSPAVLVTSNFGGPLEDDSTTTVASGGSWHTDIEYEVDPIRVSMFLVHKVPVSRNAEGGTWVAAPVRKTSSKDTSARQRAENRLQLACCFKNNSIVSAVGQDRGGTYFAGSNEELMRLRSDLPLNGETAFADTAAAFAALSPKEQGELENVQVRRRLNEGDEGWLAPLVRTNPRSGLKSLHSPIWASRPRVRPAIEVDGMDMQESRVFLDRLEAHCLQPRFRYNHAHTPGDVTLWHNHMTLHNSPPCMMNIDNVNDARLMYRLSCKGPPALELPRLDDPDWLNDHIAGGYTSDLSAFELQ